jgi:hypothetical protein
MAILKVSDSVLSSAFSSSPGGWGRARHLHSPTPITLYLYCTLRCCTVSQATPHKTSHGCVLYAIVAVVSVCALLPRGSFRRSRRCPSPAAACRLAWYRHPRHCTLVQLTSCPVRRLAGCTLRENKAGDATSRHRPSQILVMYQVARRRIEEESQRRYSPGPMAKQAAGPAISTSTSWKGFLVLWICWWIGAGLGWVGSGWVLANPVPVSLNPSPPLLPKPL